MAATEGVIRPAAFCHVFLRTNKFQEMVTWYKRVLGAEARFETPHMCFLAFDHEHHRIAICAIPNSVDKVPAACGLEHMAFGFETLEDLATSYEQRKELWGIEPFWAVNHGITMSIYYRDPDGNQVETQVDTFDNNDDATNFMLGPAFKKNPVGTAFDPAEFARRVKAGEDHAKIRVQDGPSVRGPPPPTKKAE